MRRRLYCGSAILIAAAVLVGCGGGGGGSSPPPNPSASPAFTSSPRPTLTPSPAQSCDVSTKTCFVQVNGQDSNLGDQTHPLRMISKAVSIAGSGYHIIVGEGTYHETVSATSTGVASDALMFSASGQVVIDATTETTTSNRAGFKVTNAPGTVIDGFEIINAADAGIVIRTNSDDVVVRNCIVHDSPGDGIRVQDSASVTVFNNLIYHNGTAALPGGGIVIAGNTSGSPNATIVNNTVFDHFDRGLTIGTTMVASPGAFVHDNILQNNSNAPNIDGNIKVYTSPRSDLDYDGDFNLVNNPATYRGVSRGENDISAAARFIDSANDNFHLCPLTPSDVCRISSPAIDTGDPNLDPTLVTALQQRTTTGDGVDAGTIDVGYHFPQ